MLKVFALLFFFVSASLLAAPKTEESPYVAFVKGNAFIYDENAQERVAKKGEVVKQGEVLRTAAKSLLILHIKDRVKVKVGPKTVVELESILEEQSLFESKKEDSLFVHAGHIFVDFFKLLTGSSGMKVKSKYTSLGVRGTQFFVYLEPGDDRQYSMAVKKGKVEVTSNKSSSNIEVGAGQGSLLDPNGNLAATQSYDWVDKLNWNFDPAKGKLTTSQKVFGRIRKNWENYSKKVIKKRDSYFKSQRDKFNSLNKRSR